MSVDPDLPELLELWRRFGSSRSWKRIERNSDTDRYQEVAAEALAELEASGRPTALGALKANRQMVEILTDRRWTAVGVAVAYEGATWQQVGDALGISRQAAHKAFYAALERQEGLFGTHGMENVGRDLAELRAAVERREKEHELTVRQIAYDAITLDGTRAYWPDTDRPELPSIDEAIEVLAHWLDANPNAWSTSYSATTFVIEFDTDEVVDLDRCRETIDLDATTGGHG